MTQKSRLLDYLQSHDGITSLEASRMNRPILRLSERVRELEAIGYQFERIDEKTDTAHFVRYKLLNSSNTSNSLVVDKQKAAPRPPVAPYPSNPGSSASSDGPNVISPLQAGVLDQRGSGDMVLVAAPDKPSYYCTIEQYLRIRG